MARLFLPQIPKCHILLDVFHFSDSVIIVMVEIDNGTQNKTILWS